MQEPTPQPYEVEHSAITDIEDEQNDKIPRKDSLAIPNNMSTISYSAADSDRSFDGMSKPRNRCPSQSIGQLSQIRTIKHTIKVKSQMSFIENVMRCCVAENGFDLYQIIAFDADTKETWQDWIKYIFHVLKAVLCALTQIFGIIIIMFDFIERGLDSKDWCNPPEFVILCNIVSTNMN